MENCNVDNALASVVADASRASVEFAQLAALFNAGITPDAKRARQVGATIGEQGARLKSILDELESSTDFQAKETYHTLELTARRQRVPSFRTVEQLVNWQASGLVAFAEGRPLAPMPPGVDPEAIAKVAPGAAGAAPQDRVVTSLTLPRVLPFQAEDFDEAPGTGARLLKGDFERLCREHQQLIGLGEKYGSFDAKGKQVYLDQVARLAPRWETLVEDARREGLTPSAGFRRVSEEYLRRAGLTPAGFRDFITDVH